MYKYSVLTLAEEQQVVIQLFYTYKTDKQSFSFQLGIKEKTRNLELSSKLNGKAVLPPFYMAEEVHSMFLPVRPVSCSGPFQHPDSSSAYREPPRLTPHCHTDVTGLSHKPEHKRVFSKNGEKIIILYVQGVGKCCMLTPPVFSWQKLQFFFPSKFLSLEIKYSAQFPLELKKSVRQTWLIEI